MRDTLYLQTDRLWENLIFGHHIIRYKIPEKHLKRAAWTAVHFTNWPLQDSPKARNGVSIGARAALILMVVLAACAPYVLPRFWNKTQVDLSVCGEALKQSFSLYHLGPSGTEGWGVLRNCEDVTPREINSLGKKHSKGLT